MGGPLTSTLNLAPVARFPR